MPHLVYRLKSTEYSKYRTHLLALDSTSRYTRFGYPITDELINRLCDSFEANPKMHKLFVIENDKMEVIAAGHISLEGAEAELAFSVLKEYQNQGMGSSLMKRCIEWCQNRNIKHGCMVCLATNAAVKKLAARHGVLSTAAGESIAEIKIPDATAFSVMSEVVDSHLARVDHLGKIQRNLAKMLYFPLLFSK